MIETEKLAGLRIGFAVCGSFCTFTQAFEQARRLVELGCEVTPIMSFAAYSLDTRFGTAQQNAAKLYEITGKTVLHDIPTTEPIGPKRMFDALVVAPCTGNTLAKLAAGIVDTPVCMAVKSHLRGARPVIIAAATNDALAGAAKNIGILRNYKHFYFVPLRQDDPAVKPNSLVADFEKIPAAILEAVEGKQLQPVFTV